MTTVSNLSLVNLITWTFIRSFHKGLDSCVTIESIQYFLHTPSQFQVMMNVACIELTHYFVNLPYRFSTLHHYTKTDGRGRRLQIRHIRRRGQQKTSHTRRRHQTWPSQGRCLLWPSDQRREHHRHTSRRRLCHQTEIGERMWSDSLRKLNWHLILFFSLPKVIHIAHHWNRIILFFCAGTLAPSGGSKETLGTRAYLLSPISFIFMKFLAKICNIIDWILPSEFSPASRKSWICHCFLWSNLKDEMLVLWA